MIKRNFKGKINEKQTPSSGVNGNDGDDISTDSITSTSSSSSDGNIIKNASAEKKISNNKLNEEKRTNSNNKIEKIESASVNNNNASSSKFSIDNGSVANKSLKIDDSKFSFIDNVNENEEDESDKDSETESESESDLDDASMHFLKYKSYHHAIGKQLPTTNSYQTTLSNAFLKTPTIETDVNIKPPPTPTPTQGWFKQANKKLFDTTSNSSSAKNVLSDMKRRPSQVSKVSFSKRSLNEVTSQCHIDQIMLARSIAEKQAAAAKKEQQELLQKQQQQQQQQPKVRCSSLNRMPPSRQAAGAASTTDWATLSKRITINVGGTRFETYRTTLKLLPESRLAQMTPTNSDFDSTRMEYFFDRDPVSFSAILNYYRTGKLHVPNVCGNLFYEELNFWGIGERSIQPCCWTTYSTKRDCDEILQKVMDDFEEENDDQYYEYYGELWEDSVPAYSNITNKDSVIRFPRENKKNWFFRFINSKFSRFRPTIWRLLDDRNSSTAAAILFWVSVVFLVISILNFVLETSPYCRIPYHIATNRSLSRRYRDQQTAPHPILTTIELVCNVFFAIEYVLRFLSSPNKRRFIKNPYNFLEFLAIMPLFWPAETLTNKHSWGTRVHNYIEVFYILRILRIFTLVPKYSGLRVLLLTLKNSIGELVLYMMMLLMTIMIFASFIFYAEQIFEMEDNKFDSILIGLWWAIVTMTTLGYGDIVPVTPFGYVVGGMCALCGLIFMALPIPVIVNSFTTFYAHAKAREKLREYSEIQKNLPNKAVAMQFHSSDSRAFSGLLNKLPINSVNTLSRIDDDAYIDGKYKMNADVAKFDLTQTNEIRHNNNNRKIRCNPFVRRTHRDQQNISHDAKASAQKNDLKILNQIRLKRRNAV